MNWQCSTEEVCHWQVVKQWEHCHMWKALCFGFSFCHTFWSFASLPSALYFLLAHWNFQVLSLYCFTSLPNVCPISCSSCFTYHCLEPNVVKIDILASPELTSERLDINLSVYFTIPVAVANSQPYHLIQCDKLFCICFCEWKLTMKCCPVYEIVHLKQAWRWCLSYLLSYLISQISFVFCVYGELIVNCQHFLMALPSLWV